MVTTQTAAATRRPVTDQAARAIAAATADAYSFDAYAPGEWAKAAVGLARRGLTATQVAAILRSKWTRWAGDEASFVGETYGAHTARALEAFVAKQAARLGRGFTGTIEEITTEIFGVAR